MNSRSFGVINIDYYPLVIAQTYGIDPTIQEVEVFFNELEECLHQSDGPYVFISYAKQSGYISKEVREYMAMRSMSISNTFKDRDLGAILVPNGFIARAITKTIALFSPALRGCIIVDSYEEALIVAKKILADNNIPIPQGV